MVPIEMEDNDGRLKKRSVKDIHADLQAVLEAVGLWDCLDYFEIAIGKKKTENVLFPDFEWLSCSPVTSGGGGHCIHIGTISKGRYSLIFVGKTSEGFPTACEISNTCAKELGA
ncbi:MAG: hypothetical protein ACLQT6_05480 [Desulfomonilaceae bacterium]